MSFYAVKNGKRPGIHSSYADCKKEIAGVSSMVYRKYETFEEALEYLGTNITESGWCVIHDGLYRGIYKDVGEYQKITGRVSDNFVVCSTREEAEAILNGEDYWELLMQRDIMEGYTPIYIAGVRSKLDQVGVWTYGVYKNEKLVVLKGGYIYDPDITSAGNSGGETIAVLKALEWALGKNIKKIHFYHASPGVENWINGNWTPKSQMSKAYQQKYAEMCRDIADIIFTKINGTNGRKRSKYSEKIFDKAYALLKERNS